MFSVFLLINYLQRTRRDKPHDVVDVAHLDAGQNTFSYSGKSTPACWSTHYQPYKHIKMLLIR